MYSLLNCPSILAINNTNNTIYLFNVESLVYVCPYVVSSNFLVHFTKLYFLERLYDNLKKKYGWQFLAAILDYR